MTHLPTDLYFVEWTDRRQPQYHGLIGQATLADGSIVPFFSLEDTEQCATNLQVH